MDDDERRKRLKTLVAIIAQQAAEAEALATPAQNQTFRAVANELAQLRQMLKDLETKIDTGDPS
jgi:hypothetical protein